MNDWKNILVVRTDRMGDVVLTTPALRALKKNFPQARVTMLIAKSNRELIEGNPYVDEIILDDGNTRLERLWSVLRLIFTLRPRRFDLAIIYHTKKRTNALCFFAGIPRRIGYQNEKWGFLLTDRIPDERPLGKKHESQYCLDLLRPLGVEDVPLEPLVPCRKEGEDWVRHLWENLGLEPTRPIFAVHPWASNANRQWPTYLFAELINEFKKRYQAQIILVGSPKNRDAAREVLKDVHGPVVDLTNQTTLSQFISLMRHCTLLISNDSGPVHVADAVGTPVVAIFTLNQPGVNPERWHPLGKKSTFVAPPPNMAADFSKGDVLTDVYTEKVHLEEVLAAVDATYKLCYNQPSFL